MFKNIYPIDDQPNLHFQTVAGGSNEEKEIPDEWKAQYRPKEYIDSNIYNHLLDNITQSEVEEVIKTLGLGKAPGPSQISNEMLRHLPNEAISVITNLLNLCLKEQNIPSFWKLGHIYPIPKPKEWNYDLNNTRPITLLDTVRKLFVKILNNRLSKIFVKNNVLKGNQFAGLPNQSTYEPLRILNEILDDAKEHNKSIFVLFQDLSKAYDRVNIFMLKHAMTRLKIPIGFINIITNLFTNRRNNIFTAVGTTDTYDVLTGIDQGEVISPLLWTIYYDPLLVEIQERCKNEDFGYTLEHEYRPNVLLDNTIHEKISIPIIAYMDDTTYIAK